MDNRTGSTKTRLISLLKESGGYLSGQKLAGELNVSRTAIWKNIKELEKEGFTFEAVKKKGYRLKDEADDMPPSFVQSALTTEEIGHPLFHFKEVTSTQEKIHTLAKEGKPHGTVVLADEQTAGKGRRKRAWDSPKGSGVWMSLLLRPSFSPQRAPQVTIVAASALVKALRNFGISATIKWPNDVMIGDRKVSGILTEMRAEQDFVEYIVLGLGVNINQREEDLPENLREKATSIQRETGKKTSIGEVAVAVLHEFEQEYERFIEEGFTCFENDFSTIGYKVGEWVQVSTWKEPWLARIDKIEADGALSVTDESGKRERLYSAEILWNKHY
ncbi:MULTISPECIES: biotin--[acetyl-CoA-carboxylase] ligase [Salimicrobium]|uniref:Bifunctional ligase/repressor BirA n=2 Tax=Salimicrobium TaxID=351195 RepID=A0ABY1KT34_9BACI|nr:MULTISPECIES: biotin--[acetyl-CoA-carboxylase] ligase [Salimicrobium]SDX72395.1 BirA family transcriptional regulator, biotin operon repressor / biotin-[acetyl-CoA-carboxylase] ligase [Salimicrobium album]SIS56436.1 BirA family transcriptional regulator, biotin operon repressor / biotin-[acetyl-CoA-carboxylase] ligase [Salimicrobium salexigens]